MSYPSMQVGQSGTSSIATSAETDLMVINDAKTLQKSILTFFYQVSMASATELDFRYYASFLSRPLVTNYVAADWFQLPGKTSTTISLITDGYLKVVSTLSFVDVVATSNGGSVFPGACAFKVTVRAAGAATASATITAVVRDN